MLASRVQRRRVTSLDDTTHREPVEPPPDQASSTPRRRPSRLAVRMSLAAVAVALTLGGAALLVTNDATADRPLAVECSQPAPSTATTDPACDSLWDRVRALDLPEHQWASAAEAMGLFPRGEWISDDGLRWEHLDGRTYVVATPQSSDSAA